MSAWADMNGWYDRAEAYGQHVQLDDATEGFYPEATLEDVCATIDAAVAAANRLADELAELTSFVAPEGSAAGSSPALRHDFKDAA